MPSDSEGYRISDALESIQKQLSTIQKAMNGLEGRISSLERLFEQKFQTDDGNPLIYSRVLMRTLDTIREYEKEHGHGVVAKTLARIRGLEQPTIYDHLSKLEEASLVFWQRGTELGLKPYNAKFYSVSDREEAIEDLPVLMSLPDLVVPVAQAIVKASDDGINKDDLIETVVSLREKGEKPWKDIPEKDIEPKLDEALQILLRRVLIDHKLTAEQEFFYPHSRS